MRNPRFGLVAGMVALTFFAASSHAQTTPTPTTTDPGVSAQTPTTTDANATTSQQPTSTQSATTNSAAAPAPTTTDITTGTSGSRTTTTTTDVTTPATTTGYSLGPVAIVVIALILIGVLWALLRPRNRTVARDSYTATTSRTVATNDRIVSPRAAAGTETTTTRTTETDTRL